MSETIEAEFTPAKTQLATLQKHLPATLEDVKAVVNRMQIIHALMRDAMTVNVDYGVVPGTGGKPTLLKSGAEKICVMFNLCPRYRTEKHWDGPHLTVESTCIVNSLSGVALGEASAMCSTRESKYAWRKTERTCPKCGKATIIKGKQEYGGGFLCFAKKGGCNAKFRDDDKSITDQVVGRAPNEDLADSYNTVLRIAEKRAYIAAVRLVTGSSALFDEEIPDAPESPQMHQEAPQEPKVTPEPLKPVEAPPGLPYVQMTPAQKLHAWLAGVAKCADIDALNAQAERFDNGSKAFDDAAKQMVFDAMDARAKVLKNPPKVEGEDRLPFPSQEIGRDAEHDAESIPF